MINASARFKQNAQAPVKTVQMRMTQIISESEEPLVYTSADLIMSVKIEASSTWLYSGAKKATITLVEIAPNLSAYSWALELGIVDPTTHEIDYITLGTFITTACDFNYDKGTTTLTLYDFMSKADADWHDNSHVGYPKTVEALATGIANNIGCDGLVSMTGLPNIEKIVPEDLWALVAEEKYRDVISEIANITGTTAIVNYQNMLKFVPFEAPTEELTYANLKKYKLGLSYGPINSVVLSRQPQEDNIVMSDDQSIDANGLTEAKIVNNQIADDDRETYIEPLFNALNGIEFSGIEMTTEGHGWYEIGDTLKVEGDNGVTLLPEGYDQLEYITGCQGGYIDTGLTMPADYGFEVFYQQNESYAQNQALFASRNTYGTGKTAIAAMLLRNTSKIRFDNYEKSEKYDSSALSLGSPHKVSFLGRVLSIDDLPVYDDSAVQVFTPSYTAKLLGTYDQGGGDNYCQPTTQVFRVKLYDNQGELLKDLLPAKRTSDDEIGLYDIVNDEFFANAGTGTFGGGRTVGGTLTTVITDLTMTLSGGGFTETIKCITPDLSSVDYTAAGGIRKTIYNTEIKTDKQQQEITSIVSRQDTFEDQVSEEFTQVYQNIAGLTVSVQTTGGGNLIKNSVGYSKDSDGNLVNWTFAGAGVFSAQTSPESLQVGAISGSEISLIGGTLTQRVLLAPGLTYTLSYFGKKGVLGEAGIVLVNDNDRFELLMPDQTEVQWEKKDIVFEPTLGYVDVVITADANVEQFAITDLMLSQGDLSTPWRQADGEILNTQVAVDTEGVRVKSSVYDGDETVMTPLEFAGYSAISGQREKVFSLNRDTTEVQKIAIQRQISMPPLKVLPLNSPSGWAFVKENN